MSSAKVKVKFLVDIEQKRVVFAEAGSDFVDLLFSFLTLPLGSIVRLLSKQTCLGSLDGLYESVEQLDAKQLQTKACKEMLLNPRSVAAIQCEHLKIKGIHHPDPRSFYVCIEDDCVARSMSYYTYTPKVLCSFCDNLMEKYGSWRKDSPDEEGAFVNVAVEFMITDDLRVMPSSSMNVFSLLKEMQIEDASILQEMTIDFGTKEALDLLRRSLVSKTVLTEVCFPDAYVLAVPDYSSPIKEEIIVNEAGKLISLQLVLNKRGNTFLYAEVGEDFVNLMFSFLTFPLGSVFRILPDKPSVCGCINNLYSSIKSMGLDCFKSETCRNMLMNPKLSTFYGFKNQILELEEITSKQLIELMGCVKYYFHIRYKQIRVQREVGDQMEQNPKSAKEVWNNAGAFVAGPRTYMVTDNLHISPLSYASLIGNGMNFPISDLVRKEVFVDKGKALSLLSAMLGSKTVLTDVFLPKSKRQRRS